MPEQRVARQQPRFMQFWTTTDYITPADQPIYSITKYFLGLQNLKRNKQGISNNDSFYNRIEKRQQKNISETRLSTIAISKSLISYYVLKYHKVKKIKKNI